VDAVVDRVRDLRGAIRALCVLPYVCRDEKMHAKPCCLGAASAICELAFRVGPLAIARTSACCPNACDGAVGDSCRC
jgi:hypothetical protein